MAAEYKVINKLLFGQMKGRELADMVRNHQEGFTLGPFQSLKKHRSLEIDIYCVNADSAGPDLAIEVKDHKTMLSKKMLEEFIEKKRLLEGGTLERRTGFIFYSENGFNDEQAALLEENGVMRADGESVRD